jgi:hypothetical protein
VYVPLLCTGIPDFLPKKNEKKVRGKKKDERKNKLLVSSGDIISNIILFKGTIF